MKFAGELKFPDIDHPGVPVQFVIDGTQAELVVDGESLGRWSLFDVHARRLIASAFEIDLDGTEVTFVAADPIDFAYRGVEHMAQTWAAMKSRRIATRTIAVRKSRKGTKPSRIEDLRAAMESNLEVGAPRPIAGEPAMPSPESGTPESQRHQVAPAREETASSAWDNRDEAASIPLVGDTPVESSPQPAAGPSPAPPESEAVTPGEVAPEEVAVARSEAELALEAEKQALAEERARLEEERRAAEQREANLIEAYRIEVERLEAERAELRRQADEAAQANAAAEQAAREAAERAAAAEETAAAEKEAAARAEMEREAAAIEERERLAREREAEIQAELERRVAEREAAAREAAAREAAAREAAAREAAEREAAEREAAEREAAEREAAEREAAAATKAGEKVVDLDDLAEGDEEPPAEPGSETPAPEPEPALAGAPKEKSGGLMGAVKAAFRGGSKDHEHQFVEAPGGIGITRYVCEECGYVSISV